MNKEIFRDISYGMYIVTTKDEKNKNVGCVINTLTQVNSIDPIISINLNKDNYTSKALKENKIFGVSILSIDTKKEVIGKFGYYSSKDIDKFKDIEYNIIENIPIIKENTCGYIIAEYQDSIDCNTHDIIIAKVINTKKELDIEPMTYNYYHKELKGTSPKNAPTHIEESENITNFSKYKCNICGYIYDDSKEEVKFEDLPEDWKCPLCGAPKSQFTKIN